MENLYEILECEPTDSHEDLKKSFQTLALKYHPDKAQINNTNSHGTSEDFIKVNRAWKILSDPKLRKQFDVRWAERCLVQSHPIQDTVDFEEFEPMERDNLSADEDIFHESVDSEKERDVSNADEVLENSETFETLERDGCSADEDIFHKSTDSENERGVSNVYEVLENCEREEYYYECRCGGSYVLTGDDVRLKFDIVCCDSCSLTIKVLYDVDDDGIS